MQYNSFVYFKRKPQVHRFQLNAKNWRFSISPKTFHTHLLSNFESITLSTVTKMFVFFGHFPKEQKPSTFKDVS